MEYKNENFKKISLLFGKNYLVKDYQRGYKWGTNQINALLQDISFHKNGKYCLQPIIVKSLENESKFELIDGQQRLTTIYLLWYYLTEKKAYNLSYETRGETRVFLEEKLELLHKNIVEKMGWESFSTNNLAYNNVDIYHVYEVYTHIHNWFLDSKNDKVAFKEKLENQVYVIWYDVNKGDQEQSAENVFLNLNAGKIPLTNSELIKALFILDVSRTSLPEIAKLKAFELASEWDKIENKLHDENFWYFICNKSHYHRLDTRIDFLLDLVNNNLIGKKGWDEKKTYLIYEDQFLKKETLNWSVIFQTFNKLLEWFESENKALFHYIGFLINTNIQSIADILVLSKGKDKKSFESALLKLIQTKLNEEKVEEEQPVKVYDLDHLHYEGNRARCQNVLLLFNVNQYIQDISNNKFPFDLYNTNKWSVEHINPQNPKEFLNLDDLIGYLAANQRYYQEDENKLIKKDNDDSTSILDMLDTCLSEIEGLKTKPALIKDLSNDLKQKLEEVIESLTEDLELHGIQNLALLDCNTNSKLSNRTFLEKKTILLDLYFGRGESIDNTIYIPKATMDTFNKSFTESQETIKDSIFGKKDMEDYKNYISTQLSKYYKAPEYDK